MVSVGENKAHFLSAKSQDASRSPSSFTLYHCILLFTIVVYPLQLWFTLYHRGYPLQLWFTLYYCGLPFTFVVYPLPLWLAFAAVVYLLLVWFTLYPFGLPFTTVFSAEESKAHYVSADSYQVTWWPGDRPQDEINSDSTTDDHLLITSLRPAVTYTVVVEARKMEKYTDMDEAVCKFTLSTPVL